MWFARKQHNSHSGFTTVINLMIAVRKIVIVCMALLSLACAPTMHTLIPPRQRTKSNLKNAARYVNYELVTMVTDKLA